MKDSFEDLFGSVTVASSETQSSNSLPQMQKPLLEQRKE